MAMGGAAFLALWNDVDDATDVEYNHWHSVEHVPERVGIPGFIAGWRYVSSAPAQHRYFTLYEVESPAVFDSVPYREVIDHPTPWSATMRPLLQNVVRATCDTSASRGSGGGDAIACVRIFAEPASADADAARHLIARCLDLPGVTAAHVGTARSSIPGPFEKWNSGDNPSHVLLIQGASEEVLRAHFMALASLASSHFTLQRAALLDAYHLVFSIRHEQVDASLRRAVSPLVPLR